MIRERARRWGVSADAADLHADALVWDMTLPILTPGRPDRKAVVFERLAASGLDFSSLTLAIDGMDLRAAAARTGCGCAGRSGTEPGSSGAGA